MEINITYDDELNEGEYWHPASMKVRTYCGKEYSFHAEDCWVEGLEGLILKRNRLYYCHVGGEITSPRNLAAVFYFIDVWESWAEFIFPTFDFLCGLLSIEEYIAQMKNRQHCIERDFEAVDPLSCTREQLLSILEPYIPEYSEIAISPYIKFSEEVKSLGEIERIDITIY